MGLNAIGIYKLMKIESIENNDNDARNAIFFQCIDQVIERLDPPANPISSVS